MMQTKTVKFHLHNTLHNVIIEAAIMHVEKHIQKDYQAYLGILQMMM